MSKERDQWTMEGMRDNQGDDQVLRVLSQKRYWKSEELQELLDQELKTRQTLLQKVLMIITLYLFAIVIRMIYI